MKISARLFAILALPLAALSCKDEDTSESGKKLEPTPSELRGTWQSACLPTSTLNMAATQREYVFNAVGDFDRVERYFSDDKCQNLVATYKVVGTVEDQGKNPQNADLRMVNFTINNAYLTVNTDAMLNPFNAIKLCGKSDWHVGEDVEVTNADCEGSKVQKGGVQFDSYAIREGQLYLGQKFLFLAKENAEERPAQLDMNVPYAKK